MTGIEGTGYRAFISYSHADARVAKWLHRELETYRVPGRLTGTTTATGEIGKTVGKIFRDRDELSVSADLTGEINQALRQSEFLIVLCSPASAKSKWVNQEIINFKRLKGAERIIAVIASGEPFASEMLGRETEECFPPALRFEVGPGGELTDRPAEPVAADLRAGKDGKRLAKMKVLSGLLGVQLDELIKREVQRRNRQLFAAVGVMGVIVIAMSALSIVAVVSRNEAVTARDEARRQKDQAEGLIDFMLGDLREKLRPVGRLDSLEAVGERAGRYFESLRPEEIDTETRARLARTKVFAGEVLYSQGRSKEAAEHFQQAHEITSALYQAEPEIFARIFDHAQSEYWLGYDKFRNARYAEAEEYLARYAVLAQKLVDGFGENLTSHVELASALTNLGAVRIRLLRFEEALDAFENARVRQEEVIARQPALITLADPAERSKQVTKLINLYADLGQILAWEADGGHEIGRLADAIARREQELQVYRDAEALESNNVRISQAKWVALHNKGLLWLDRGEPTVAFDDFKAAIAVAQPLSRLDQDNKRWAQLLGRSQIYAAEALLDLGQVDAAQSHVDLATKAGRDLTRSSNINKAVRIQLVGRSLVVSAEYHFAQKSYDRAWKDLREFQEVTGDILKDTPDEAETLLLKSQAELLMGDLEAVAGRAQAATEMWQSAVKTTEKLGSTTKIRAVVLAAMAQRRLGEQEKLSVLLARVCPTGYRRGEFRKLCGEV